MQGCLLLLLLFFFSLLLLLLLLSLLLRFLLFLLLKFSCAFNTFIVFINVVMLVCQKCLNMKICGEIQRKEKRKFRKVFFSFSVFNNIQNSFYPEYLSNPSVCPEFAANIQMKTTKLTECFHRCHFFMIRDVVGSWCKEQNNNLND